MKVSQVYFKKWSDFNPSKFEAIEKIQPDLIFVFGGVEFLNNSAVQDALNSSFGKSQMIGCTTAGEISNRGVYDQSLVVSGLHFDKAHWQVARAALDSPEKSFEAGTKLGEQLKRKDLKGVFLISQGVNVDPVSLLKGVIKEVGPSVPVSGGLAGDEGKFQKTFTFFNGELSDRYIVAVGFSGDVKIQCGSQSGFVPIGIVRKATKAKGNVLYEIDNNPALKLYQEYLADNRKNPEDPAVRLMYPFAILDKKESPTGLIRSILSVDEKNGSITLAGDIEEGTYIRMMSYDREGLVQGAAKAVHPKEGDKGFGLLVSCIGRKLIMGDSTDDEVEAVHSALGSATTVAGFYSYGEFGPQFGFSQCQIHNQTMTVIYINE